MKKTIIWSLVAVVLQIGSGPYVIAGGAPEAVTSASIEGFNMKYSNVSTPEKSWGGTQDVEWVTSLRGEVETKKSLSYRGRVLGPGSHDVWVESGKGEWLYLYIGDADDPEAERVRAMFKLYEQENGVEELKVEMKLTRKDTKLKFSILAGRVEGHCNFRVVE